jgi:peptidylprolyl isomerase
MKKTTIFIILIILVLLIGAYKMTGNVTNSENTKVLLKTNQGEITIELYSKEMSITAGNFEKLVKEKVYDNIIFHRIIDGFMIQGGDPTGTGFGDPKIPNIQDEFTNTDLDKNNRGTLSMANAGPNTGSSQFFINLVDNNFLDNKHPVFGRVIKGMDVVDKIAKVQTDPRDKPLEDVVIIKAEVI